MKKIMVIMLGLLLVSLIGCAHPVQDVEVVDWKGDGNWSQNTWYITLYPGEQASIELKVEFPEGTVVHPEYDISEDFKIYFEPSILRNSSGWLEVTISAPRDKEPGEYKIGFILKALPIG